MEVDISNEGIISSDKNKYLMKIKATYDDYLTEKEFVKDVKHNMKRMSFKINGKNNLGCIDISVVNFKIPRGNTVISDYAIINSINSDTSCSIAGNLEPGIGTRDMIYTSLQTVLKLCPWVKYFKFNDYSKKKCSNSDSGSVSLSYYYIALYGKTWYEEVLHAKPENLHNRAKYYEYIKRLKEPTYKMKWTEFYSFLTLKQFKLDLDIPLMEIYTYSATYEEFFTKLKQHINNNTKLCVKLSLWIEDFIVQYIFSGETHLITDTWIAESSDIPKVQFKDPWFVDETMLGRDKFRTLLQQLRSQAGGGKHLKGYKLV
jgi:hypothetical protein